MHLPSLCRNASDVVIVLYIMSGKRNGKITECVMSVRLNGLEATSISH